MIEFACVSVALSVTVCAQGPGQLDPTFGTSGIVTTAFGSGSAAALSTAIQPDGKIVAAGYAFLNVRGAAVGLAVARYNTNGSLDPTFGSSGMAQTYFDTFNTNSNEYLEAVAIQSDGKIVVGGFVTDNNYGRNDFALVRYNASDGSLDTTFSVTGEKE